jgi:hypothetical protein
VRFAAVRISFPTTLTRAATVKPIIDAMTEVHTGQREATCPSSQRPAWAYVTAGASIVTKVGPKNILTPDKSVESLPKTHADTARTIVRGNAMPGRRGGGAFHTSYYVFGQRGDKALTHSTGMGNAGSINQRMKFDKYA